MMKERLHDVLQQMVDEQATMNKLNDRIPAHEVYEILNRRLNILERQKSMGEPYTYMGGRGLTKRKRSKQSKRKKYSKNDKTMGGLYVGGMPVGGLSIGGAEYLGGSVNSKHLRDMIGGAPIKGGERDGRELIFHPDPNDQTCRVPRDYWHDCLHAHKGQGYRVNEIAKEMYNRTGYCYKEPKEKEEKVKKEKVKRSKKTSNPWRAFWSLYARIAKETGKKAKMEDASSAYDKLIKENKTDVDVKQFIKDFLVK